MSKATRIYDFYTKKHKQNMEQQRERQCEKERSMVIHKISVLLRTRYCDIICGKSVLTMEDYSHIIGCSERQLATHLEGLFEKNMTFHNHGEWEVDHIFPVSKCDINDADSIRKCFHYTNLQPLWKIDNRMKSNKIL